MIQAYFNQIQKRIVEEINNSNKDIIIAVAWFTQHDLFNAIINALDRGVNVSLILIKDIINCGDYGLDFSLYLQKGGKLCFVNTRNILMHNKFCIFDGSILITGSYNWTYSAERRNAENIIITDEGNVCQDYSKYFANLWNQLTEINEYSRMSVSDIEAESLIQEYNDIVEEYKCMQEYNVIKSDAINPIYESRKNIGINKLATIITQENRQNPTLKMNIGMRCQVKGVDNRTLNIIKQGQMLPYTNTVDAFTAYDNQNNAICDVLFGNSENADNNKSLLKIELDNLPQLKARKVKFKTKVTIDTNGYMHVEFVCVNTGISKEAFYNCSELINY
jgi:hypothetical protein